MVILIYKLISKFTQAKLLFQDMVDSREECAWLNSGGLELNQFIWILPTVRVGVRDSYHSGLKALIILQQFLLNNPHSPRCNNVRSGVGHFSLILSYSQSEF